MSINNYLTYYRSSPLYSGFSLMTENIYKLYEGL